jgi:hypothetical protein
MPTTVGRGRYPGPSTSQSGARLPRSHPRSARPLKALLFPIRPVLKRLRAIRFVNPMNAGVYFRERPILRNGSNQRIRISQ